MRPPSRTPKLQLQTPLEVAISRILRYRFWLTFSFLLAVGAGVAVAFQFASSRYTYQGKMLYTPNRITEPFYVSPGLDNLVSAIVTPGFLEQLHAENHIEEDLTLFRKNLRFEFLGDSTLDAFYTNKNEQKAARVLQQAMERFVETAKRYRNDAISKFVIDFNGEIEKFTIEHQSALKAVERLLSAHGLASEKSLVAEIDSARRSLGEVEDRLEAAKNTFDLSRLQIESLLTMRGQLPVSPTAKSTASRLASEPISEPSDQSQNDGRVAQASFPGPDPTLTTTMDLQMRTLLEDRIAREKEISIFNIQLAQKRKDYERAVSLHQRELISDSALDEAKAEFEVLQAKQTKQVKSLESQLETINGRIKDRITGFNPSTGMGIVPDMLIATQRNNEQQTLALLHGAEQAAEANIVHLQQSLDQRLVSLEQLVEAQKEAEPLLSNLGATTAALERARHNAERFEQTQRSEAEQLAIVEDATLMIDGIADNRFKLFLAAFVGTLGLLLAPVFAMELLSANSNSAGQTHLQGLPILARQLSEKASRRNPAEARQSLRRAAVRIGHVYGSDRGVIAIASDNVSRRDVGQKKAGKKSESDVFDPLEALASQFRADGATVKVTSAVELLADELDVASSPKRALAEARSSNDIVLVAVPLMNDGYALESIVTHSDAVVIAVSESLAQSTKLQPIVAGLYQIGTPILGFVVRG